MIRSGRCIVGDLGALNRYRRGRVSLSPWYRGILRVASSTETSIHVKLRTAKEGATIVAPAGSPRQ